MPSDTEDLASSNMDDRLAAIVQRIPGWKDRPVRVSVLGGGLTNSNFRVDVDGESFVVRIPGESTELLSIDRENERFNTQAASEIGVAPRIVHYLPDEKILVMEFIAGETMSKARLCAAGWPARVGQAVRRLHGAPRFQRDFDMLALMDRYHQVLRERGYEFPRGFRQSEQVLGQVVQALRATPQTLVSCHNDLLPENFIDSVIDGGIDGDSELRIVDFEYSGNNDPCFELGNLSQEMEYDESQIDELCAAYFTTPSEKLGARVRLNMIVSDAVWSLWASIQRRISRLDFDFDEYGQNRWERAHAKLHAEALSGWLKSATGQ